MLSLDDLERKFFQEDYAPGSETTLDHSFLEHAYWAKRSGLLPKEKWSLSDHMYAALKAEHKPVLGDTSPVVSKNIVLNPSAEVDANSWTVSQALVDSSSDWATVGGGSKSFKLTPNAGGTNDTFMSPLPSILLEGGITYTLSGTIYIPVALTGTLRPQLALSIAIFHRINPAAYTFVVSEQAANVNNSTQRLSLTFTPPVGTTDTLIRFYNGSDGTAANLVYWDNILIEKSSSLNSYYDGDSVKARWIGARGNSESVLTDPSKMTTGELLLSRYMSGSGLSGSYSSTDHMQAYYRNKLGVS